jgi:hypothetical protein
MSDDTRPGGEGKAWVDPDRTAPDNAYDKAEGYSGQEYRREDEAAQGRADDTDDTPHRRNSPKEGEPASPEDFSAPRGSPA